MTEERTMELERFGHHPEAAIDYCIEVEELEGIALNEYLGLNGFGHEQDRAGLDGRIEKALAFRVGGDLQSIEARRRLKALATRRGFNLMTEIAYEGQPVPRLPEKDD